MSASEQSPRITPFLWFDSNAEEAVDFYLTRLQELAPDGQGIREVDDPSGPKGIRAHHQL